MQKKTFNKILIAIMAVMFILISINVPAFASITEEENTGSITITNLEAGVTAYIYQLIEVNYNYEYDQPQDPAYIWVEEIQEWISNNYPEYINTSNGSVTENFDEDIVESTIATAFYSKLAAEIKGGDISLNIIDTQKTDGEISYPVDESKCTYSVTFSGLDMGSYLVLVEDGYRVYTPVVANLMPEYNQETEEWELNDISSECKSTTPTITKTLTDETTTSDNYSTIDTISYTIITDIPTYEEGSLYKTYSISDSLDDGLTLDMTSITIYGVNGTEETLLTANTEYTLDSDESGFTADFIYDNISGYKKIKIVYMACLNQDSTLVLGENGNGNTATLTYSNNPYSNSSQEQKDDNVTVYTYGIEITKVDSSDYNKTLEGAEFNLLDSDGNILYFVYSEGIYYLSNSSDKSATLTTDSEGKIYIKGLDVGTYQLQETKAPDDYSISTSITEITIADDDIDGILNNDSDAIYTITFPNTASFILPYTGSIGTTIFTIIGIVLIVTGMIFIIINKKKNGLRHEQEME